MMTLYLVNCTGWPDVVSSGSHRILPISKQQECNITSALVPRSADSGSDPWREHDGVGVALRGFPLAERHVLESYPGKRPLST